jgi:spore coat protein SA
MAPGELAQVARGTDVILSCSRYIQDQVGRSFAEAGVGPPERRVFYNFVDTTAFDPAAIDPARLDALRARLGLTEGRVVLFVGRMIEPKGPHLALRAFRLARDSVPDALMLFVGAPWYSRENRSRFVDSMRAEARDIEGSIRFTGYVDHRELPYYYALAGVAVVPSIWGDPSPLVAYEAQAMGVAVVGSDRGGIPEILEHGETGFCLDAFDTRLFARRIVRFLGEPGYAEKFGLLGRRRALERFDLRAAADRLRRVYEEWLGPPR